jgi:hypothetical protein
MNQLLRRYPSMRRVALAITHVLDKSWGALSLFVLTCGVGATMGFILLGGRIYDARRTLQDARVNARDVSELALLLRPGATGGAAGGGGGNVESLIELRKYNREERFVMPHSRVLLFTPGRAAAQGLAGWPARVDVSLASSPTNIGGSQSTVSGTDEQEDKYQSGEEGRRRRGATEQHVVCGCVNLLSTLCVCVPQVPL